MLAQWDPLMQKMNQTGFTKLTPSPAASALISAAAHERHSISAGLELIKLSISDNPRLYTSLHSICTLVFTLLSFFLFFCPAAVWFWLREEDGGSLKRSAHHIMKCALLSFVETWLTSWPSRQKGKKTHGKRRIFWFLNFYIISQSVALFQ